MIVVFVSSEMSFLFRLILFLIIFKVRLIILLFFNLTTGAILVIRWRLIASLLGVFWGHHDRARLSFKNHRVDFVCVFDYNYSGRNLCGLALQVVFINVLILREFEYIFFVILIILI